MIEIRSGPENDHSFRLLSSNGQILLESVQFSGRRAMKATIAELKVLVAQPTVFERRTNYNGEFLFLLKDGNGNVIGNSMSYSSEAGMENGIENLRSGISKLPNDLHL